MKYSNYKLKMKETLRKYSNQLKTMIKHWKWHCNGNLMYRQANGIVEKEVQTLKNLLTKTKQDFGILIWDYLNTATQH